MPVTTKQAVANAMHEVKEWQKGQQLLYEELENNKPGYYGARSAKRLITDCYGRGVVRGAVETSHLITSTKQFDPTSAESIKTAPVTEISLQYPLQLLRHVAEQQPWPQEPRRTRVDKRNRMKPKVMDCPPWTLYGGRGQRPEVHLLSAYEFARHYHIKQARHPFSAARAQETPEEYEAELTEQGLEKATKKTKLFIAGVDYTIRESGGEDWLPLGHGKQAKAYRHDWIIRRRPRPHVPVIFGAQSSKTVEEQAMRILALYFPWVNDPVEASPEAPFINDLWQPSMKDWKEALLSHAARVGFPTIEVKQLVMNHVFTYCLPRQTRLVGGLEENSDNEDITDDCASIALDEEDLLEATLTHVRGSHKEQSDGLSDLDGEVDGEINPVQ